MKRGKSKQKKINRIEEGGKESVSREEKKVKKGFRE